MTNNETVAPYLTDPRLVDQTHRFVRDDAGLHQSTRISEHNGSSLAELRPLEHGKVDTVATNQGTVLVSHTPAGPQLSSWNEWLHCAHVNLPFGRFYLLSCLTSTLIILIMLNLALSAWIIVSLRLHQTTNPLKHAQSGHSHATVQVDGTLRAKTLQANSIESMLVRDKNQASPEHMNQQNAANRALVIEALKTNSLQLSHVDPTTGIENSLTLSENNVELKTSNFVVQNSQHRTEHIVLQVTPQELSLDGQTSQVKPTTGGMRVTAQLNTSELRSDGVHDFRIESRTGNVHLGSDQLVEVESMSGQVQLSAHDQVILRGALQLDGTNVQMGHLRRQRQLNQHKHTWRHHKVENEKVAELAYQLCVCGSGHLFAADVDSTCEADSMFCAN